MELKVKSLAGKAAGTVTLSDAIFGLEPRADILHRMVRWQLAKRQAGTHKTKTRGEVTGTGKKMYKPEGHRQRPSRQQGARRSSVAAARPSGRSSRSHAHRPAEEGAGARAEACALGQGQGRAIDRRR